ncbi:protein arginine N-methyltransferase 3 [Plakobranchus ocellatus]|uniref:type I protein arginine methyltransferase n=1 Tax=Plakobranchus ocellatus TaxID=259542 RepID=A0AAV3YCH8_9GAST|nr:protein arginine N-methyltransferase 3 [Plakobranchus ocellatus]
MELVEIAVTTGTRARAGEKRRRRRRRSKRGGGEATNAVEAVGNHSSLQTGKQILQNMATCGEDNDVPDLVSDNDSEADCKDEDVWEDDYSDGMQDEEFCPLHGSVTCLFCSDKAQSVEELLYHCSKHHNFNIVDVCRSGGVDCISYIKMINYVRQKHLGPETLLMYISQGGTAWSGQEYMAATDPEDLMLQLDIESAINARPNKSCQNPNISNTSHGSGGTGDGYAESDAIHALICRIHQVEAERDILREELNRALQQIEKLKIAGQEMMLRSSDNPDSSNSTVKSSLDQSLNEEDGYFASYTHHDIHMTMLKDKVRTESYRDFMLKNPQLFEGKTVLDVGCGTGILSMFAVKAGARQVVAVDQSNIIYQAMDIARENNMHEKITFVKGRLEDVVLPFQKFDIIISEWMGYFLLFEAMLDSVLWARDRYLNSDGCVYPDHFSMKVVGISDQDLRKSKLGFWDDVYGFKMSCMKTSVSDEVNVRLVKEEQVVTEPAVIKDLNVMQCTVADLDFISEFSLKCLSDAEITAVVGYFDTDFNQSCSERVSFSTGPQATPTHWEQAVMMLPSPITVHAGAIINCKMIYRKHPKDSRGIIITLHIDKHKLKYTLS